MVDPTIAHHVINATIQNVAPIVKNVVPTLQPDSAPLWLDVFIWMALFWQYILIGFVPAFYIAVAKLFGMPLLQRWRQEVVIMLYPNKVVFCKIKEQMEPYFAHKNGIYWFDTPIQPLVYEEDDPAIQSKLVKLGEKYEVLRLKQEDLASPDNKMVNKEQLMKKYEKLMNGLLKQQMRLRKRVLTVNPGNTLHIYTHAVNQPITRTERRESKVDEILNNNPLPKQIKGHGVWLMQNPKLHFHRHYQIKISEDGTAYQLIPVKDRQQFSIGFWHSLGIIKQSTVEIEVPMEHGDQSNSSGTTKQKQLVETTITTNVILQQSNIIQDYQNFSASRAFMLLKRRARIEDKYNGFLSWITGSFDARILFVLAGMVGVIAVIYFLFAHGSPATPGTPTPAGVVHIL